MGKNKKKMQIPTIENNISQKFETNNEIVPNQNLPPANTVKISFHVYGPPPHTTIVSDQLINDYEFLKQENNKLKSQLLIGNQTEINTLIFKNKELQGINDELKKEIERLTIENKELKEQIANMQSQIDILICDKKNIENQNKFSDVFRYFREHILLNEKDRYSEELHYCDEFDDIDEPNDAYKILNFLYQPKAKNANKPKYLKNKDARKLFSKMKLNPDAVLRLKDINGNRNLNTHFIDHYRYSDKVYMKPKIEELENIIKKLEPNNIMYDEQTEILEFITTIKQLSV